MKRENLSCQTSGTGVPSRAICVARRGTAWHGVAMPSVGNLQATVFIEKQVADKDFRPKWQFWQQKQRLALFCSLLRGVW